MLLARAEPREINLGCGLFPKHKICICQCFWDVKHVEGGKCPA